jgi:hypothetical protein
MKVNNNFAAEATRSTDAPKRKYIFSYHNHVTNEQTEGEPVEMTPQEAQETFRRAVMNSFSPFESRSYREVK